jgi:hypothetical protein
MEAKMAMTAGRLLFGNRLIVSARVIALVVHFTMPRDAAAQAVTGQPITLMDRQREIALALSSCPSTLAQKAGVYVLEASGYVKVRESQNGFTAIVQHSVPSAQEPQCMDAEGARTILPRIVKVAKLRAQGKSPEEIKRFIADAFAKGIFQPPRRVGIDYMLSKENVVPNDNGVIAPFPPHIMFYAPFMTNAELGSEGQAADGPAFVAAQGTPYALIIVPVPTGAETDSSHGHHQ